MVSDQDHIRRFLLVSELSFRITENGDLNLPACRPPSASGQAYAVKESDPSLRSPEQRVT